MQQMLSLFGSEDVTHSLFMCDIHFLCDSDCCNRGCKIGQYTSQAQPICLSRDIRKVECIFDCFLVADQYQSMVLNGVWSDSRGQPRYQQTCPFPSLDPSCPAH